MRVVTALLAAAVAVGLNAVPASADTLAGEWAAFAGCPVDAPAMLAADGDRTVGTCLGGGAPNGTIVMGSTSLAVGSVDMHYGLLNEGGVYSLVVPADGGLSGAPVTVPGGLLGLMCPSDIPVISDICEAVVGSPLNTVTATLEPAGPPTDFDLSAAAAVGKPLMKVPVKVHLQNPFLAPNCYIGSNSDPIRLTVANQTRPTARFVRFDADGTANPTGEMNYLSVSGAALGDSTFSVPAARGCGLLGLIDSVVNAKQGLPSPSGENSLVLNETTFKVGGFYNPRAFAPTQGQQLSARWHAAAS